MRNESPQVWELAAEGKDRVPISGQQQVLPAPYRTAQHRRRVTRPFKKERKQSNVPKRQQDAPPGDRTPTHQRVQPGNNGPRSRAACIVFRRQTIKLIFSSSGRAYCSCLAALYYVQNPDGRYILVPHILPFLVFVRAENVMIAIILSDNSV